MTMRPQDFHSGELECFRCLFFHGPTFDGGLPSKQARNNLVDLGYVNRVQGYNYLNDTGMAMAFQLGLAGKKEVWRQQRRASSAA